MKLKSVKKEVKMDQFKSWMAEKSALSRDFFKELASAK